MDKMDYAKSVSRLRAIETRLIDKTKIERMKDASTPEEVLRILGETEYSTSLGSLKKREDYEIILSEELKKLYKLMYEVAPEKELINIFSIRYDYHNIKVLLKGKYSGKDYKNSLIDSGTIPTAKLQDYMKNSNYRDLLPIIREAIEVTQKDYSDSKDGQRIDIILDRYLYKDMLNRANNLKNKFTIEYVQNTIDLINIKTYLRVKKQNKGRDFLKEVILEGGKIDRDMYFNSINDSVDNFVKRLSFTNYSKVLKKGLENFEKDGSIILFERLSEDFIMSIMKDSKLISFGPEPLVAYIIAKETEIKLLRIIMVGKLNNIPSSLIGERLRDSYV